MKASKPLLRRLPVYLNYLKAHEEEYPYNISARQLAEALNLREVMVRKDLAAVSNKGCSRIGHIRVDLIADIEAFLNYSNVTDAVLVGAGKLGLALLEYSGFEKAGLHILAGFDTDPVKRRNAAQPPVYSMSQLESFCRSHNIHIGIITVAPDQAQKVCDALVACGIQAIWNFAPTHLISPDDVLIQNEDLAASLAALRMNLEYRYYDK